MNLKVILFLLDEEDPSPTVDFQVVFYIQIGETDLCTCGTENRQSFLAKLILLAFTKPLIC
jgi:hypothetical protein